VFTNIGKNGIKIRWIPSGSGGSVEAFRNTSRCYIRRYNVIPCQFVAGLFEEIADAPAWANVANMSAVAKVTEYRIVRWK
jgi:hypothetical protein